MLIKKTVVPHSRTTAHIKNNATPQETAQIMRKVILEESGKNYITQIARQLCVNKNEPVRSAYLLCNFAYSSAMMQPDAPGLQIVRTPAATLRDKRGNCVDYTVLIGAIATAAGLPVIIKVVAFDPSGEFAHVYPVVNGFPCDVVPFQKQDGTEYLTRDPNATVYPTEKEYAKYFLLEV
jgi:hypothetical protein